MRVPLLQLNNAANAQGKDIQAPNFESLQFDIESNELSWNNIPLMKFIKQYGTPLRITYLPRISSHIQQVKLLFEESMKRHECSSTYTYCYPTKSSHFRFVLDEVLKNDTHLEISSAFDVPIIRELYRTRKIDKSTHIICNGHKQPLYTQELGKLVEEGFNVLPVLDSMRELSAYEHVNFRELSIGIRIASNSRGRTSRLGVPRREVCDFYRARIQKHTKFKLKMLHIHVDTGIRDTPTYWNELSCFVQTYCKLQKMCPHLDSINIGGGLPIAHSLDFAFDYEGVIDRIIATIAQICNSNEVPIPHLFTEFGSYTVGESGATIYQITEQKRHTDKELWYLINGSFITQLPDIWGKKERFICLPINKCSHEQQEVLLGGLTCDSLDIYAHVSLPEFDENMEDQYIGFFNTGAYQEELGGYGGISHCLVPAPKHIIVDRDDDSKWRSWVASNKQRSGGMVKLLGFATESQ